MKKLRDIILLFVVFLASCERQEEVDLKVPYKRKLVVAAFIGAGDSEVLASISYTSPVFGAPPILDPQSAGGVIGSISVNGGEQLPFVYDTIEKICRATVSSGSVNAGDTYELSFTDGADQIKGRTTVPPPALVDVSVKFDSVPLDGSLPQYFGVFTATLKSALPAYVRIMPVLIMEDSLTNIPMHTLQYVPITLLQTGQSFTAKFYAEASINGLKPARITCLIITCDEGYARYANATHSLDFSTTLPGSEPSMLYSNMSNNIGIVASYNICESKNILLK